MVAILGVPFDANSSFLRGPALAPARFREAFYYGSMNFCAENGTDLNDLQPCWADAGDVENMDAPSAFASIISTAGGLLEKGARVLSIGGDHSVTFPLVQSASARFPGLTILHLDAHPDLYDELDGNRFSHASPFARIMENGLAKRLVQVGVRTVNPHQRAQAERFGVEMIRAGEFRDDTDYHLAGPLYVSIDLDVLDPAFAPGVSHQEPGGLSVRDVLRVIQAISAPIAGADIVEYNPIRDLNGMTAMVVVKLLKEILVKMIDHPCA